MFIKRKNTSRKKYAVDVVCSELQELVTKPNSAKRMLNNNKESFISVIAKSLKTQNLPNLSLNNILIQCGITYKKTKRI